jgi:hypothetical protein
MRRAFERTNTGPLENAVLLFRQRDIAKTVLLVQERRTLCSRTMMIAEDRDASI